MPALNFQKRIVSKILSGEKRQTIRAKRKNPIKVNDTLRLWTGQRTKRAKHLIDVQCGDILDIEITENEIIINDISIIGELKDITAQADGFKDWYDMKEWFEKIHGLPFKGNLIVW